MSAPTIDETYGAMLIGLLIATFLQGMLTVQLYQYYISFPKDPTLNKVLVGSVWCLDLIHLIFISHPTYYFLVTNWGNPAVLTHSTVLLNLHLPLIGITTIICQIYFLHRVWLFTEKNIPIMVSLVSLCIGTLVLGFFITVKILEDLSVATFYRFRYVSIPQFIVGAMADIGIAVCLCWYLDKGKGEYKSTNNIISRLVRYTIATGAATSLLAVACTIAYMAKPQTMIFVSMHFSMGRMYTNALLATLNARTGLRSQFDAVMLSGSNDTARSPIRAEHGQSTFTVLNNDSSFPGVLITKHKASDGDIVTDEAKYSPR
ncbi:hypothetical protein BDN72DRAFT_894949 [Pluteus cervinus]|uniref:Uncharacterized protein n=1 Tax=Pluteus cervinus TaxID=181527 RepID=A0ACD3B2J3_9AGAR|nr:hypothetical protein BDN72DRAFT_894949 [Pluteus cervinus]